MSTAVRALVLHRLLLLLAMGLAASGSHAAEFDLSALRASSFFVQAGAGNESTRSYVAGATWNWRWHRQFARFRASGYFEADIGRWTTTARGVRSSSWVTQAGLTPVIRLQSAGAPGPWFAEFGIGANYIIPLYQTGHKRFSTQFNFGDHLGIGRRAGANGKHEFTVRLQHFSNAGIEHPNPGENFVQLRYSWRL